MTDGRSFWYAEDTGWLGWENTVTLGEEFGAAAVSILCALKCDAKLQRAGWKVKGGFRSLSRKAYVDDADLTRRVVEKAAELGTLDELEVEGQQFTCKVSGMAASEARAREATKKARQRAEQTAEQGNAEQDREKQQNAGLFDSTADPPTRRDTPGQDGTPTRVTGQDRTEEKKVNTTVELALDDDAAGEDPRREVVRRLFDLWVSKCGKDLARTKLTRERRRKVEARLREGYTEEQIAVAIDGAARAAYTNQEGMTFDDLTLICQSGSKLELFMDRAGLVPSKSTADFIAGLGSAA